MKPSAMRIARSDLSVLHHVSRVLSRALGWSGMVAVVLQPFLAAPLSAQVVIDPSGNVSFQTSPQAVQGTGRAPVVDIARPNAGRVSLNRFESFNVDDDGLVLNNAKTGVETSLVGAVTLCVGSPGIAGLRVN